MKIENSGGIGVMQNIQSARQAEKPLPKSTAEENAVSKRD